MDMKRIGLFLVCWLAAMNAQAAGLALRDYSASGLGAANAVVAGAGDVSAAAYNPAGLAWQDGVQGMVSIDGRYRNSSVDLGAVGIAPNRGAVGSLSYLYMAWMPHDYNLGISLAYNRAYEASNEWAVAFPGAADWTTLSLNRLSFDAIYRSSSSLAVALGGDWYMSTATMIQGAQTFNARAKNAFGGHLSLKWKFAPTWALGAMLRKGATVKISDAAAQSMRLTLPDEFTLGLSKDFADRFRFEVDADWTRWSKLKDFNVTSGATVLQSHPLSLKDSLSVMAGFTWFWRENTEFRFGYAYQQGIQKSTGFNPVAADQTGHRLAIGMGGNVINVRIDLAYSYIFYPKLTVTGPFAGIYRDRRQTLSVAFSKEF